METGPPAVAAWSVNHSITREVLESVFLNVSSGDSVAQSGLGTISLVSKLPVAPRSGCAVSVCVSSTFWGYPALQPGLHSEVRDRTCWLEGGMTSHVKQESCHVPCGNHKLSGNCSHFHWDEVLDPHPMGREDSCQRG